MLKNRYTGVKNPDTDAGVVSDALYKEARSYVHAAAEPRPAGDSVKAAILRASRETSLSVRRATTLWYGYPCRILAEELDRLRHWHAGWLDRRLARLSAEIALIQAKQAELNREPMP